MRCHRYNIKLFNNILNNNIYYNNNVFINNIYNNNTSLLINNINRRFLSNNISSYTNNDGTNQAKWSLHNLSDNYGARKKKRRVGRGPGSRRGKTSGRGMKGRNQRQGSKLGYKNFEGGQTSLFKRIPKHGFTNNQHKRRLKGLNLYKLMQWINDERIDANQIINLKVMYDSNVIGGKIKDGVKLLGDHRGTVDRPLHIEVTDCSESARKVIEAAGGSVKLVYFNRVGLRAHLKPHKFDILPRTPGVPPNKYLHKYAEQFNELVELANNQRSS